MGKFNVCICNKRNVKKLVGVFMKNNEMVEYNVNDLVRVRKNLNLNDVCHVGITSNMINQEGKIVKIVKKWESADERRGFIYSIDGLTESWTSNLFEPIKKEELKNY